MPPTTYVGHNIAKQGANSLLPGSGDLASAASARLKDEALRGIQQRYFHDTSPYKGGDIAINDAKKAIQYVRSKKLTKSNRKAVIGGVKVVGFVVGAATGATLGSVVPVAGTVAGGVVGGVAIGSVVSGGVTVLDQMKRKAKGLYKIIRGTRGEHRHQAAKALLFCRETLPARDPKHGAAVGALIVILDEEYDEVMEMSAAACEERVADRMKSN